MPSNYIVQGFKFHDAAITWELQAADLKVASLQQILERFYGQFDFSDLESFNPLGWARNPENKDGTLFYGLSDVIVVPFRRGFYIVIEKQYRELYGPHSARLLYKGHQCEETIWVAIMQVECYFYSDDKLRELLLAAIHEKAFYQSEHTQQQIVIL